VQPEAILCSNKCKTLLTVIDSAAGSFDSGMLFSPNISPVHLVYFTPICLEAEKKKKREREKKGVIQFFRSHCIHPRFTT
jgi:hypothetical protein